MSIHPWQATHFKDLFPKKVFTSTSGSYGAPNDFGRVIHELLFSKSYPGSSDRFLIDVRLVAEKEGFNLKESRYACSVRDYRLMVDSGEFRSPNVSNEVGEAANRCMKRALLCKDHAHLLCRSMSGEEGMGAVASDGKAIVLRNESPNETYPSELPASSKSQFAHMYFEGGNLFTVTGPQGKKLVICGEDNVTITHQMMRLAGLFRDKDPSKMIFDRFSKFSDTLSKLYLNGEIPALILEMGKKIEVSSKKIDETISEMASMGLVPDILVTEEVRLKAKEIVVNYLAQKKFIEEILIPNDLKVEASQMVYLLQIDYHEDCLMAPGPNGTILLQDYEQSLSLLHSVRKELTDRKDKDLIEQFIDVTKKNGEKVKGIMQKVRQRLEQAGLTVIPTPGAFFAQSSPDEKQRVNFFNAITGFSPKTNRYYYIVGGTSVGAKLGFLLMDGYAQFLQSLCPDKINLYYVGRDPQKPDDYSFSDNVLNDLDLLLGVHCLSLETKISAHGELS